MAYVPVNFGMSNAGNTSGNSGTVSNQLIFAGGNNITLSQSTNAQGSATITISAPNTVAQSNLAFSASGGSTTFQTLNFTNSNGLTFSNTNGSIRASYTVPTVTNSSWTVSDNATSATVGRLAFTQSNGLTMSLSTSNNGNHTVIGSYTVPTVTNSSWTVSDANTSATVGRLAFTQSNGLTLSLSTSNNGNHTVIGSYTVPNVPAQTNQTIGVYGSSQTTGSASSGTYDARSVSMIGAGIISIGNHSTSAGGTTTGVVISATQSNQAMSAQGGSSAFQTLNFTNSNNLSFSNTGGSVWGSYAMNVSATGGTSNALSGLTFKDSNNVSFGLSTGAGVGTLTASVNAGGVALVDGAATISSGSASMQDGNGVSWGINGQTLTASVAAQSNQTLGLYALGNTTQNSSTTLDARTVSFNGLGGATVGYSNGSVQISVPNAGLNATNTIGMSNLGNTSGTTGVATGASVEVAFAGGNNITLSQSLTSNSATITISAPNIPTIPTLSRFEYPDLNFASIGAIGQGSLSIERMYVPFNVTGTAAKIGGSLSVAVNTSATVASANMSLWMGIYTLNGSTLSLASSGSANNAFQFSQTSSSSGNTSINSMRQLTVPMNVNMTPGQYWMGAVISSATTYTSAGFTMFGNSNVTNAATGAVLTPIGSNTTANRDVMLFQGIYTANTSAGPTTIVGAGINNTSASNVQRANFYNAIFNATY